TPFPLLKRERREQTGGEQGVENSNSRTPEDAERKMGIHACSFVEADRNNCLIIFAGRPDVDSSHKGKTVR
ncbi:hypothetical protein AVEN_71659-1, partial [Araneus ventricosus]